MIWMFPHDSDSVFLRVSPWYSAHTLYVRWTFVLLEKWILAQFRTVAPYTINWCSHAIACSLLLFVRVSERDQLSCRTLCNQTYYCEHMVNNPCVTSQFYGSLTPLDMCTITCSSIVSNKEVFKLCGDSNLFLFGNNC